MTEGISVINSKNRTPKYFPSTISKVLMGFVNKSVNIPLRFSSEMVRIVKAGTKNTKIHDEILKNGSKSAKLLLKMLYSVFRIHKNNPFRTTNSPMIVKPMGEVKK